MAGVWKSVSGLLRQKSFFRGFKTSAKRMDEQVKADCLGETHKPTNFQKKTLVWAKMYKSLDEVPERVSTTKLKKAQDIGRIYGTSFLIAFGAIGSLGVIVYSRNLRKSGQDGINRRNQLQVEKWMADAEKEHRQKTEADAASVAAQPN